MKQRMDITAFCYDKRGRLLSTGKNSYVKTHTLQARYANAAEKPNKVFLHAEIDAIIRAKGKPIHKIVVMRVGKKGNYCVAKPCEVCMSAIKDFGIKEVEWTT